MKTRICLAGATGKVGRLLVAAIQGTDDLELVAAVSRSAAGRRLCDVVPKASHALEIQGAVEAALAVRPDVLIDFTRPEAVYEHVLTALEQRVHCVVGTSGLSDEQYIVIDRRARECQAGVIAAGNFSLTATLLQHFALQAARHLPHWEICDFAPDTKPDAPSGTSRELANQLGMVRSPACAIPADSVQGLPASRGANLRGTQIHSIRVPGYHSSCEIVFGMPEERLTLRHDSMGSAPYVSGTLLAARRVSQQVGLRRGLASVLGLQIPG